MVLIIIIVSKICNYKNNNIKPGPPKASFNSCHKHTQKHHTIGTIDKFDDVICPSCDFFRLWKSGLPNDDTDIDENTDSKTNDVNEGITPNTTPKSNTTPPVDEKKAARDRLLNMSLDEVSKKDKSPNKKDKTPNKKGNKKNNDWSNWKNGDWDNSWGNWNWDTNSWDEKTPKTPTNTPTKTENDKQNTVKLILSPEDEKFLELIRTSNLTDSTTFITALSLWIRAVKDEIPIILTIEKQ